MHFVFTIGDIIFLLFLAVLAIYFVGLFLWTLTEVAWEAIKADWTGKNK